MNRRVSSRSLLVLHQGALGDFILALAVIQSVRKYLQAAEVTVIASAPSAQLAVGRSVVDRCISPENVRLHELFSLADTVHSSLQDVVAQADWVLSFLGDDDDVTAQSLRRISGRSVVCVDPRPTADTLNADRHITEQWAASIRSAGWDVGDPTGPRIAWKHGETQHSGKRRHVMIHPGSGSRDKCWSADRFMALADKLDETQITWLIGPAEVERDATALQKILDYAARRTHECVVDQQLSAVVDRMRGMNVYVGNDAGTTHLAAAIGIPVVAIFQTTDPRVWRPLNPDVTIVRSCAEADEDVARSVKRHLDER